MKYWFDSKGRAPVIRDASWEIEAEPAGSEPVPKHEDFDNCTGCFVTSYLRCEKYQIIKLSSNGILSKIMDEYQPTITASEWYL